MSSSDAPPPGIADWREVARRAAFASHRLVGWIYWDPDAIARYAALGVPNGMGYYVASRAAPLLPAGAGAVSAAFYSINPDLVRFAVELSAAHTDWRSVFEARNAAVSRGLAEWVPGIRGELAALAPSLWEAADSLPDSGRVLFAAHRDAPRPDDQVLSAWLAVNCLREWRGDTHFAILLAEGIDRVQAGILHDAHLNYGGWIPQSRGADQATIAVAMAGLEARGLARDGEVTDAGREFRESVETRTNELCEVQWRAVGAGATARFLAAVEPVGEVLLRRIDETAGPNWMPAARERRP